MEIPIQFRLLLKWKNLFNDLNKSPKVSISKEGKGVKSVLFLLPESIQEAKLAHYLVKVDNIEPGYTFGYVCNEKSKNYYPNSSNVKFMTYRDIDLNYFGTIKSEVLLDQIIPAFFLIAVLILILPGFLRSNSKLKQISINFIIWSVIVGSIVIISKLIF